MTATDGSALRPVLVVTDADDLTADMVIAELNRREVPVVRFNPSDLGEALTMSARLGGTDEIAPAGYVETPSRVVSLDRVRSAYWRRPTWPDFSHLDDPDARSAAAQVRHGLGGTLYALSDCLYVNHPLRNHAADFKPSQLALAQRLGLTVAPTLVSNRIDDIRDFIKVHDQVIYKVLRWTSYRRDDVGWSTWTQPVGVDEIDESVRITPHLFQARIDKIADVRVTIVGRQVFALRIDSDLLDWRADYDALTYQVIDLPYGTGLAKLTVTAEGTARGRLIRRTSFMPARAQADTFIDGDMALRMAYPDTERTAHLDPGMLGEWMPAFLAQLAAPGTQLIRSTNDDGEPEVYLFDIERESFASLTSTASGWKVRQGGPAAVWDAIEDAVVRWQEAGNPDIDDIELAVTQEGHTFQFSSDPSLRWVHRVAR